MQPEHLLNAQNTEKSVTAIRSAEISISTSAEEADEAAKASNTDTNLKKFKCDQCNHTKSSERD